VGLIYFFAIVWLSTFDQPVSKARVSDAVL